MMAFCGREVKLLELPFCLKGVFQFPVMKLVYSPLAKPYSVRKRNERAIADCVSWTLHYKIVCSAIFTTEIDRQ